VAVGGVRLGSEKRAARCGILVGSQLTLLPEVGSVVRAVERADHLAPARRRVTWVETRESASRADSIASASRSHKARSAATPGPADTSAAVSESSGPGWVGDGEPGTQHAPTCEDLRHAGVAIVNGGSDNGDEISRGEGLVEQRDTPGLQCRSSRTFAS
jgi:hypothetical protein